MTPSAAERPAITRFSGDHAFLSNFHPHPFTWSGRVWPSSEHAYQASKTLDPADRDRIRAAPTPGVAKRLGRRVALRPDWDAVKRSLMRSILVAKFSDPALRDALAATGDARLVEGNTWGDTYWGVCRGQGRNHLGRILEQIRHAVRARPEVFQPPAADRDDHVRWLEERCLRIRTGVCERPACHRRAGGPPGRLAHALQQPTCPAYEILERLAATA